MPPVNQPDRVPSSRRARARATRLRITRAAYALFCDQGYSGTTMSDIADAAGVAVQTVYFIFHTKSEVLSSTYDLAVGGEGEPVPPQLQPWYAQAVIEADLTTAARSVVDGAGEIVRRVALLDLAVRSAAASDPDAAAFLRHNEQMRLDGYREMIDFLRAKSELRPGLTAERATDVLLLLVGPASYRALVSDRGWSHAEWAAWTVDALLGQVFGVHERATALESPG